MNDVFGSKLGQYILLEQIGEGGMAKVYNAFDSRVERNVAIKVILPSKRTSKVFLQQFEREAKALANLTHTNIVKVLNYGIEDGRPYLVMEYIPGGTLKEAMNQKLPWQTAAAILAPIARALDYVHQQQIVHRDVKPSNILLQEDFSPMLSDFGIMKLLEGKEEKVEAAIGAGVGTPEYMPPEQGMGKDVDFRADIYSLGLVFYEMITGQKPYTADSPMAMVIKHVTDELPLPTRIDKNIPKFVERAILRAVQKDPQRRYLSMSHFADVLELIALGDKAPERKIIQAARQREQRKRSFSIVSLSVLLVLMIIGTSVFAYNYLSGSNTPQATSQAVIPPAATNTSPSIPKPTSPPNKPPSATIAATESSGSVANPSDLTLMLTPIVQNRASQFREIARWGIGGVNVIRWSPDGSQIALGTTSGIFLVDSQSRAMDLFIDTQFDVASMEFNPQADEITAGSKIGDVKTWNSKTGAFVRSYTISYPSENQFIDSGAVTGISYSSDGQYVAVGFKKGVINYYPVTQSGPSFAVENYPSVEDLAISFDNRFIYASNGTATIQAWDIHTENKEDALNLVNPGAVTDIQMSPDRQLLLAGGSTQSVYLWDVAASDPVQINSFPNPGSRVTDFDFSYDNKYVVVGLNTGAINIFETPSLDERSKTLTPSTTINAFNTSVPSISFSPKQLVVASGNEAEGFKLWDALNGTNTFSYAESMRGINKIYFSKDGAWLATGHDDGVIRVWDVNQAKEVFKTDGYLPKGNPFSPNNRYLAFIYSPGQNKQDEFHIFDLEKGAVISKFRGYQPRAFIQFSNDSKLLVMGDPYNASIWDTATWELVNSHGGPTAGCGQYFTPQNTFLALISNAGIMFKDFKGDKKLEEMCGTKPRGATFMYYFYDKHEMFFVLGDGRVWSWGFNSDELARIESPESYPSSSDVFLTADQESGWYAYVTNQNTLHLENINSLPGVTIAGQDDYHYQVSLLPGKKLFALGSQYGSIHIWTMP